ncbi:hypothetical protein COCCADRAFT_83144 [Bipolaris zeicola 26-R-13]|uniref:Uncharacterized protein n=1 Tax=Cochliobolus carbonum (strain 26-R-13) TaxID=930089 RepID=W6YLI8_COCC2|nr:uncharacterized protein COCCADRAFT_83144 [Bipolaris zeicola 26-R-13]EUC38378.1 hypothetical protein COCCADRAFT_83144 [Bipolaris zeicola 26-R-13]
MRYLAAYNNVSLYCSCIYTLNHLVRGSYESRIDPDEATVLGLLSSCRFFDLYRPRDVLAVEVSVTYRERGHPVIYLLIIFSFHGIYLGRRIGGQWLPYALVAVF